MGLRTLGASLLSAVLLAGALSACQPTDPKNPKTWIAQLDRKNPQVVQDAVHQLRLLDAKSAVQPVTGLLKRDNMDVRTEAAYALETFGDKAAVPALIAAVDLYSSAIGADMANAKIAEALGVLRDPRALPVLEKMAQAGRPLVRLAAVDALGTMGDRSSIQPFIRLVEDQSTPPLITKHAIIALGNLRAAEAVRALEEALVMERSGISFFVEASYALFQIGEPAAKGLMAILSGEDKPYLKWADDNNRQPAGYLSKAAIVLADIGYQPAVPQLIKLMSWSDPDDNDVYTMIVRGEAATALGRLRAKAAASVIASQVTIEEANIREKYAVALAHIGATNEVAKLEAAARNQKDSWSAREAAIVGVAMLGDAKAKPTLEAIIKEETPASVLKECLAEDSANETAEMKQARCAKEQQRRPKLLADELATLMAGESCKSDVDCWLGKLKDKTPPVRERAAYTLGELGAAKAVDALVATCKDDKLPVRRAAYIALDWLSQDPAAKSELVAKRALLAQQLADEKGKAYTVVVNEDLKRVVWKLDQL